MSSSLQTLARTTLAIISLATSATVFAGMADADGDGVGDVDDNCALVANASQIDGDADGIGNRCDADLNQDCVVNAADLGLFRQAFFTADAAADFNGDGVVQFADLGILRALFLEPPGLSGLPNACTTDLTLNGTTDLANAVITASVAGMAGITTVSTTANAQGDYTLTLTTPQSRDFVTLSAAGTGADDRVQLRSVAGSAISLRIAGGVDGTVDQSEANALRVSTLTTSLSVFSETRNGGPLTTDAQYHDGIATVDSALLFDRAVVLRALIDNPDLPLPGDVGNTLDLLTNLPALAEFRTRLQLDEPALLQSATDFVVAANRVPYTADDIPTEIFGVNNGMDRAFDAYEMTFASDGTGTYTRTQTETTVDWTLTAQGSLMVTTPQFFIESVTPVQIPNPDNPNFAVIADRSDFLAQVEVVRFFDGPNADHVFVLPLITQVFLDYPQLNPVTIDSVPEAATARVALDAWSVLPYTDADVADRSLALQYYHTDNMGLAAPDRTVGYDTLDFAGDGTGTTRRRDFAFDWDIDATGVLTITFPNGDQSVMRQIPGVNAAGQRALTRSTLQNGEIYTHTYTVIEPDPAVAFTTETFPDRRYRSGLSPRQPGTSSGNVIDLHIESNGFACQDSRIPGTVWTWGILANQAEVTRTDVETNEVITYRTIEPLLQTGNQIWVNLIIRFPFNGQLFDGTVTPGNLFVLSVDQELADNQRPLLNSDSFDVNPDEPVRIFFRDLFANDVDPESDEIFYMDVDRTTALGGTVAPFRDPETSINVGLLYTPPFGVSQAADSFTYTASDIACPIPNGTTTNVTINIQ